jgi:hypothetical protein
LDHFNSVTFPKLLAPFPTPVSSSVTPFGWIDALNNIAGGETLEEPLYGYDAHDTFYAKSVVTKNDMPLTEDQLTSFWSYVINQGSNAPSPWFSIINLYGGPGSQINVPSPNSSAYSDRDALWVLQACLAVPL